MLHKNVLPGDIHLLPNWKVADATALAALTPVLADEGKMAWQEDNDTFHILVDYTGPTWKLINTTPFSGAAADVSIADAGTYYTGTNVEDVLQEVGADIGALEAADTSLADDIDDRAIQTICVAVGDETTALTTGTSKVQFHWPLNADGIKVFAGLRTAQASGATLVTVDVNIGGGSIFSTVMTFDNTEKTTLTAATPPVLSDTSWDEGQEVTIDIDNLQSGSVAAGLKVYFQFRSRLT